MKLYELQIKITCTISELITIIVYHKTNLCISLQSYVGICGKHLHDLNVNDKLSDHGIKTYSFITIFIKCVMTNKMLNSL